MSKKPLLFAGLILGVAGLVFLGLRQLRPGGTRANCAPLRILFIGNSYVYVHDMPGMLSRLAEAGQPGACLQTDGVLVGGATLRDHWAEGTAQARIAAQEWDYVVLQEQSQTPLRAPRSFHASAGLFNGAIRDRGARTLLFATWARKHSPQDQAAITGEYHKAAGDLGAEMAPAGAAWHSLAAVHPGIELYDPDGSGASPSGAYLTACVFYATLFRASPAGLPAPAGVDPAHAPLLQQAAWAAVSPLIKR